MLRAVIALFVLMLLASGAEAQKRVALVIGNSAYQHTGALANPVNDARDIAAALTPLEFQVILGLDLNKQALDLKLREFARSLKDADVGVFFYAGHGLQVKGANYLVATDAKLDAESDLDFETLRVDAVLSHMEREAKTNIVFLDACRNNPLVRNLARTMGTRGAGENNGLAPVASALGTFIAFATQPGNVASDGAGRNSPFSAALKKHILAPGMSVTDLMVEVRKEVVGATKGSQVPWDHSALQGRFYFKAAAPAQVPPSAPSYSAAAEAARICREIEGMSNLSMLGVLANQHKGTPAGDCIAARMDELKRQQVAAAEKAKREEAEQQQRVAMLKAQEDAERARPKALVQSDTRKRVALVIGNSAYNRVPKLPSPTRDAAAVETLLRAAGFDAVVRANDLGVAAMRRALRDFSDKTHNADIAVVFYAGHGMEVGGVNYLIPTDAVLERDIDVEDETVSLDRVTQILEPAKRLRLVILDACRDNPFVASMRRTVAGRSVGRGLGLLEVLTADTLIAFAAKAGSTAADGTGANSPYTLALVKHLTTPGLDLRLALGRVRDEVLKSTGNRQEPFVYGSLGGDQISLGAAPKALP